MDITYNKETDKFHIELEDKEMGFMHYSILQAMKHEESKKEKEILRGMGNDMIKQALQLASRKADPRLINEIVDAAKAAITLFNEDTKST